MEFRKLMRCLSVVLTLALVTPAFAVAADTVVPTELIVPAIERISWAAVLAGLVVALAVHMALSALGIGIGASRVHPHDRINPTHGVPTMMMVWMFASALLSLFSGGWVAGRLAGTAPFDSAIHGIITWALATVVMFLLATTSLGIMIGGTFRLLSEGASTAALAAAAVAPETVRMAKDAIVDNVPRFDWRAIQREATHLLDDTQREVKHLLDDTGKPELNLEKIANKGSELVHQAEDAGNRAARNPDLAEEEISELLSRAYGIVRETLNAADRDAVLNVITARTNLSKDEANKTLEKWEKMYGEAKQKFQLVEAQIEETARTAADAATTAISRVAFWTFASLACGVAVAAMGGSLGSTFLRL